ncbi:exocyst complex component EXO70B1-like [Abrus precatorius]|uniref:Exocyst subunit Exo70 family protein n=1 Tax=Abrus precatorius TaxID=3816 RepID=A0A8B8JRI1_ABRPR|nr:exocyst complex component EXO70B1-like [Abrus precatorius]
MSPRFRKLLTQPKFWRSVGFVSSVIGMLCYAWALVLDHFGEKYHILKISLYGVVSFTVICVMLFPKVLRFTKSFLLKALVGLLALMLTSLYNFFSDKDSNTKICVLSLISNASFALMLLSLSKQNDLGFEPELLNFYLGCLTIQLMKVNLWFILVGATYCYFLNVLHSHSDFKLEIGRDSGHEEHVAIEIDTAMGEEREANTDHIEQLYFFLGIDIKNDDEDTVLYPHDLEIKLVEAMVSGFEQEHCYHVFCGWRRQFLEEKLLQNLISIEDVHKMPLKYLKDKIERWVQASKDAFRSLFPNERDLSNRVFGFSPFADRSFMVICNDPTIYLLNFANAVASTSRSPERLFRILVVYENLNELLPDLESLFSGDDEWCVVLLNEAKRIYKGLREAIRGVFMEMENLIRQDPAKVVVLGGGLHPTNRYVMNYLFGACQCWKTLELAFEDEGSPSSSLSIQVAQILDLLERNLKANSKIYKDSSLCSIFMMNNWRYIVHKVEKCELRRVFGEDWIQNHVVKMGQHLVNYQRNSWNQVLGILNVEPDESAESWKEKLNMLKLILEEISQMQGTWVVIDDQIREVIRRCLKKTLLPAFENFIERVQNAGDYRGGVGMNEDFGVHDVVALVEKLFQGKDEHRKPRVIQPTWTVVMPNTQDFHEWVKYAQKTILSSTYPRKYYKCIYKNDQGCRARKHVQQTQDNPKMYTTSYSGFHTCNVRP